MQSTVKIPTIICLGAKKEITTSTTSCRRGSRDHATATRYKRKPWIEEEN
jgi:hypothetical protein